VRAEDVGDVGEQNKKLSTSISKHKQDLEALRERDPEFYAYLQVGSCRRESQDA
jgi:hypothetical protein